MSTSFDCLVLEWTIAGVVILDPLIIVASALAALIGVWCGQRLWSSPNNMAAVPFFGFALMMSEAAVTHCLSTYFNGLGQATLVFIDVGLTSSIALSFLFIALMDLGVFDDPLTGWGVFTLADVPIWVGWYYVVYDHPTAKEANVAWLVLYVGVIVVCCGTFAIVELVMLLKGRFRGVQYLLVASVAGYVGLKSIYWCNWPVSSLILSPQVWWFFLSDVSMFFVYLYFSRRGDTWATTTTALW